VAEYIRRTAKHHGQGTAEGDLALFLDLDLSILGGAPSRYARYAQQIGLEYCHIGAPQFCIRRAAVLKHMAGQPSIYFCPQISEAFEAQARANLGLECKLLGACGDLLQPYSDP
jgi:predicted metal-dependent HD superfamily phosphohydrolase